MVNLPVSKKLWKMIQEPKINSFQYRSFLDYMPIAHALVEYSRSEIADG